MIDSHDDHASPIKTPKQLIAAVLAAFIVPIIVIVLLVKFVASEKLVGEGLSKEQKDEATIARIQPVADQGFTFRDVNAVKQLASGEEVYKACAACHASGAAGAPKFGDAAAWAPRIAQGYGALVANAIKGVKLMPPKGGNPDLDDVEVARAVVHMANAAGAKFKEPEVKPAAAAPAASAPAASAPAAAK